MNREILFRGFHEDENGSEEIVIGKKIIKGMWLYGGYHRHEKVNFFYFDREEPQMKEKVNDNIDHLIILDRFGDLNMKNSIHVGKVIPETVCQYTGLDDKNNKKIFEGDIVYCSWLPAFKHYVTFIDGSYYLKEIDGNRCRSFAEIIEWLKSRNYNIEIICSIHDKEVK